MPATTVAQRLNGLPWSRWHWRVVLALGITRILDGLEVPVGGALGPTLQRPGTFGLSMRATCGATSGRASR